MMRSFLALPLLALALTPAFAQDTLPPGQAAMRAHIATLSADAMKGRAPFSPEYRTAAEYVASQLAAAGVAPAGDEGGFFQRIPFVSVRPDGRGTMTVTRDEKALPLVFGDDFLPAGIGGGEGDFAVDGDVVFVGYGVVDPASGTDDYAGLDVNGRIVALFPGGPDALDSDVRAHYGSAAAKAQVAAARGAKGIVLLEPAERAKSRPLKSLVGQWEKGSTTWASQAGEPFRDNPQTPLLGTLSQAGAAKLFAGSPLDFAAVAKAQADGAPMPRGALGVRIAASQKVAVEPLGGSDNVVGMIEGGDPALKGEFVVLSAHLDHVGVDADAQPGADAIYNGAMDNALGVAALIEVAREFQRSGERPRRSVLFLAVTAEETGLLGSDYFARNPTVPKASLVANLNVDMPVMTYDFVDLVALGGDRSSLGPVTARVASDLGFARVPDPSPEYAFFVRTDHYSFVKQGVPSITLDTGPGGAGATAIGEFLSNHYHEVSDEIGLIDMSAARDYVGVTYGIARALADADQRPTWNEGDFFGEAFGGGG